MTWSTNPWTEERVELLKKLHREGISFSLIAAELGGGITRNGAIGKAKRLGLTEANPRPRGVNPVSRKPRVIASQGLPRTVVVQPYRPPPIPEHAPTPKRISIFQLRDATERRAGTCKWAVTEELPHAFCGHETTVGHPYCAFHDALSKGRGTPSERRATKDIAA